MIVFIVYRFMMVYVCLASIYLHTAKNCPVPRKSPEKQAMLAKMMGLEPVI